MLRLKLSAALAAALPLSLVLAPVLVSGCGGATSAYIPDESRARAALDAALSTWQQGGKIGQFPADGSSVHFVDHRWEAGETLEGYQLLEEKPGQAETEKRYTVALTLKKPAGEKRVEYIAVGRAPMWIFLDEDYTSQVSMGEGPKSKPKPRPRSRGR